MQTIRQAIFVALAIVSVAAALLVLAILKVHHWNGVLAEARASRFDSASLADELRQSSDDLTRLARTFVVTGEPKWEKQFLEVLDIPARQVTCPAFGGADLTTLYVTSATQGLSAAQLSDFPDSGKVFALHGVAQGQAEHRVIL